MSKLGGQKNHENLKKIIHQLSLSEVYDALKTSEQGLTQSDFEERLQEYGSNTIQEVKGKPLILKFLANFTHLMAILLWVGGVIGFIAQMPQLGIAIWMVNIINGVFSFWQEFR
ncbi:MAG TPA: cation-transporting P-type ATPase, partial [Clostridium sp.]